MARDGDTAFHDFRAKDLPEATGTCAEDIMINAGGLEIPVTIHVPEKGTP